MKAEISIKCDIITDYEEALEKEKQGKIVWTIFVDKQDRNYFVDKIIKKSEPVGYVVLDKTNTEIITSRREKWSMK